MSKVSCEIGLTLKLKQGDNFEMIKPMVQIADIDTSKDVEKQIAEAKIALTKVWDETTKFIEEEVFSAIESNPKTREMVTKTLRNLEKRVTAIEAAMEEKQ